MTIKTLIKKSEYHDSVTLMLVARELTKFPGVIDVGVIMATEANKALLKESGLLTPEAQSANPNDLVIAVSADDAAADAALLEAERLLKQKRSSDEGAEFRPRTLRGAVKMNPNANVAVISVAGRYATDEAWDALRRGLHVLLFSDNVSLEDEIALKTYARDHGLLLMGPGAGTAILNGVALGFANVVPSGPVGIVSAAGTGLQEVSTLLAKHGVGITQGLGTGGRDLKEEVGGMMMLQALQALQADPATKVIALVSKPPSPGVAEAILDQVAQSDKPTVIGFMGANPAEFRSDRVERSDLRRAPCRGRALARGARRQATRTIAVVRTSMWLSHRARRRSVASAGERTPRRLKARAEISARPVLRRHTLLRISSDLARYAERAGIVECAAASRTSTRRFAAQRQAHLRRSGRRRIHRGSPASDDRQRSAHSAFAARSARSRSGRHHARCRHRLRRASRSGERTRPGDPAGEATRRSRIDRRRSVTGTEQDPQRLSAQVAALQAAGAIVCDSNAAAAKLVALIVGE